LLEPELATVLTGRSITRSVWPFSFREFLRARGKEPRAGALLENESRAFDDDFSEYLRFGGLPEVVTTPSEDQKLTILRQYFRDIIYRDVVVRHRIRTPLALEQVAQYCLTQTASPISYKRIKDRYGLAMDQVRSYARFLSESYLIRELPKLDWKLHLQAKAERKVYATDVGLRNAVAFAFSPDLGRLAETVVFGELVRDETPLYYFKGKNECDFIVWKGTRPVQAIQVHFAPLESMDPREGAGLEEALNAFDIPSGLVLTKTGGATISERVSAVPVWRWLLDRGQPLLPGEE
jgi:hypothetical protein